MTDAQLPAIVPPPGLPVPVAAAPDPVEPTLDELRERLAPGIAANAAFDGWTDAAVTMAAEMEEVDADVARLAYRDGALDMIDAWFAHVDRRMAERWPASELARLRVRERVQVLVEARLEAVAPDREALRRAVAVLALHPVRAAKLGWRAADAMWRLAGDTAVDFNHYTKRATLMAVYASTVTVFLDDESEDMADTRGFLSRRIDGVMRFEKAKAAARRRTLYRPSLSRFVGRLRYPAV